jgi:hypothetical protein
MLKLKNKLIKSLALSVAFLLSVSSVSLAGRTIIREPIPHIYVQLHNAEQWAGEYGCSVQEIIKKGAFINLWSAPDWPMHVVAKLLPSTKLRVLKKQRIFYLDGSLKGERLYVLTRFNEEGWISVIQIRKEVQWQNMT